MLNNLPGDKHIVYNFKNGKGIIELKIFNGYFSGNNKKQVDKYAETKYTKSVNALQRAQTILIQHAEQIETTRHKWSEEERGGEYRIRVDERDKKVESDIIR